MCCERIYIDSHYWLIRVLEVIKGIGSGFVCCAFLYWFEDLGF